MYFSLICIFFFIIVVWRKELWILVPQPEVYLFSPLTNRVALSGLSWKTKWFSYLIIFRSLLPPDFTSGKLRSGRIDDTENLMSRGCTQKQFCSHYSARMCPPCPVTATIPSDPFVPATFSPGAGSPLSGHCRQLIKKNLQTCYHR